MTSTIAVPSDLRRARERLSLDGRRQEPARWRRGSWVRWASLLPHVEGLPERIGREAVTERARLAHESEDAAVSAFVASMIWGYGSVGYGPFRTDRVLRVNEDVARVLQNVAAVAREEGPGQSFAALARKPLHYLGPAFGTKYLYFCTAAHRDRHRDRTAPVLDRLVRRWLARHAGVALDGSWSPSNYGRYLALIEGWGEELRLPSDQVEELIFERQRALDSGRSQLPDIASEDGPVLDAAVLLDELRVALEQIGAKSAARADEPLRSIERIVRDADRPQTGSGA